MDNLVKIPEIFYYFNPLYSFEPGDDGIIENPKDINDLKRLLYYYGIYSYRWGKGSAKKIEDLFRECRLGIVTFSVISTEYQFFSALIREFLLHFISQELYNSLNNKLCKFFNLSHLSGKSLIRKVGVVKISAVKLLGGEAYKLTEVKQYFIDDSYQLEIAKWIYSDYISGIFNISDTRFNIFRSRVRGNQSHINKKVRAKVPIPQIAREALIYDLRIPNNVIDQKEYKPGNPQKTKPSYGESYPGLLSNYTFFPYTVHLENYQMPSIILELSDTMVTLYEWSKF